jgi:uncharacterized protein YdeI (YjbR/CyaY-like superfamily)
MPITGRKDMEPEDFLNFDSAREWRDWLALNHAGEKEAWLVIRKKDSRRAGIGYSEALEEALCYGWIDGKMKSVDGDTFILRFSPRKPRSVWARTNKETAERLIASGRMTDAGLAVIKEAKENGTWDNAYTNRVRDEIPAGLEAALSKNSNAHANFHNFANSYRNMYIGWINAAKTDETRRKRIAKVVELSIANKKLITD